MIVEELFRKCHPWPAQPPLVGFTSLLHLDFEAGPKEEAVPVPPELLLWWQAMHGEKHRRSVQPSNMKQMLVSLVLTANRLLGQNFCKGRQKMIKVDNDSSVRGMRYSVQQPWLDDTIELVKLCAVRMEGTLVESLAFRHGLLVGHHAFNYANANAR